MEFVDREEELEDLRRRLTADRPALVRVYGRRRLGKTALLMRLTGEIGGLFLVCEETNRRSQLVSLARQIGGRTGRPPPPFETFYDLLRHLEETRPGLVILDEFPRLAVADCGAPSQLQRAWDERRK